MADATGKPASGVRRLLRRAEGAQRPDDPETVRVAARCREQAVAAMESGDWYAAYQAAKWWVAQGGGAWAPEAWLLYAVSAVLHGQARTGVHSMDVALRNWVGDDVDREVLLWTRGSLVMRRLQDPKTALPDFEAALPTAPPWLRPRP